MTDGGHAGSAPLTADAEPADFARDTAAIWRFAAASNAGTSHVRDGLPCQDAHRCGVVDGAPGRALVAVVADGAGSASEGGHGAAFLCDELFGTIVRELPESCDEEATWLVDCVSRTRSALLAEADAMSLPARELAATLLCAVLTDGWATFAQIGDGAIVTPESGTEEWAWLFWPHRGEYANTTSFITDARAMDLLQVDALPHPQDEVALFTDGLQHLVLRYDEQTVHSPFFERMMGPVRASEAAGEDAALCAGLQRYLNSDAVTARSDDDLTLVMASRRRTALDDVVPS